MRYSVYAQQKCSTTPTSTVSSTSGSQNDNNGHSSLARCRSFNANFNDALSEHGEMIEVLVEQFGDARPIAATAKNFAATIEAVLLSE